MNAITTSRQDAGLRPMPQSREIGLLVSRFQNRLEDTGDVRRKCISSTLLPSPVERQALETRRAALDAATAADNAGTRRVLLALLGSFPSYGEDSGSSELVLSACVRACSSVPTWAVQEAAGNFLENRVHIPWDMAKRPTPPQILAEARWCMLPVEEELHRIGQILDAEVVDVDTTRSERDEALARWAEIRAGIAASNVISERTDDEIARERSEMQRANEAVRKRSGLPRSLIQSEQSPEATA